MSSCDDDCAMASGVKIDVPQSALLFILLQRTAYQSAFIARALRRLPRAPGIALANLEAFLRRDYITSRFQKGILGDYASIERGLPNQADAVLDIGCGVAGIDVLLHRRYSAGGHFGLYLVDFDETSVRLDYGFGHVPARYNSLKTTNGLLRRNGIPQSDIHFVPPGDLSELGRRMRFELVVSLLAWGFHFPIETYIGQVASLMEDDGILILDVRRGTAGLSELGNAMNIEGVIDENPVRLRVVARKR